MDTSLHFSSHTDLWATPQDLFERLDACWHFTLDVCAIAENAKCKRYFSPDDDGLAQEWLGTCWMNPPYGREIGKWVKKAYESGLFGATVVCLLPARTDTAWWHDYAVKGEVEFLRSRLKFGSHQNSAPFPSAIVSFVGGLVTWHNRAKNPVLVRDNPISMRASSVFLSQWSS
jgi:phage N-6-adenine-methyltransferase